MPEGLVEKLLSPTGQEVMLYRIGDNDASGLLKILLEGIHSVVNTEKDRGVYMCVNNEK